MWGIMLKGKKHSFDFRLTFLLRFQLEAVEPASDLSGYLVRGEEQSKYIRDFKIKGTDHFNGSGS